MWAFAEGFTENVSGMRYLVETGNSGGEWQEIMRGLSIQVPGIGMRAQVLRARGSPSSGLSFS